MPDEQTKPDPVGDPWERFAKAATVWIHYAAALSPYSLDYRQRIAERWYELRVGPLFRELEHIVTERR